MRLHRSLVRLVVFCAAPVIVSAGPARPPLSAVSDPFSVLYTFGGTAAQDGRDPFGRLLQGSDGSFYGTTTGTTGGLSNAGTIFRIDAHGAYTLLHVFTSGSDGSFPYAGLIRARDGAFYGTTTAGGPDAWGTVYRIDVAGNFTVLHAFDDSANDGGRPSASPLIDGGDGRLYGTTVLGGPLNGGTVFSVGLDGTYTVLHIFTGNEGLEVDAGMIRGLDGAFYGTTKLGGTNGRGTIYRIDTAGNFAILHQFASNDGFVQAPLIQGQDGAFYGTSPIAGPPGNGAVFRIDLTGSYSWLAALPSNVGTTDVPIAPLAQDSAGNLYGTLIYGGTAANAGVVYRIDTAHTLTFIHEFTGVDGAQPGSAGLVLADDGAFYGTTTAGGAYGSGTVFTITPAGTFAVVHDLSRADGGGLTSVIAGTSGVTMIKGADGALYGTFADGGILDGGVVFRIGVTLGPPPLSVTVSETVHVSDDIAVQPAVVIAIPESVRIADTIGILPAAIIALFEHVSVTDAVSAVPVLMPSQMLTALLEAANQFGFQQGAALLRSAQSAFTRGNETAACNQLSAFLNQVRAQRGKSLTPAQAAELSSAALQLRAALGCQ